jgi:hypothetical protein
MIDGISIGDLVEAIRDVIDEEGEEIARRGDLGRVLECIPEEFLINVHWERTGFVYAPDAALDIIRVRS